VDKELLDRVPGEIELHDKVVVGDSDPASPESLLDTLDNLILESDISKLSLEATFLVILLTPARENGARLCPLFRRFPSSADAPTTSAYWPISV